MKIFDDIANWIYPQPKVILTQDAVQRLKNLGIMDVNADVAELKNSTDKAYAEIIPNTVKPITDLLFPLGVLFVAFVFLLLLIRK